MTTIPTTTTHASADPSDSAPARPAPQGRQRRADTTTRLLKAAVSTADALERRRLLDEVVVINMGVAKAIAARYRGRGLDQDDLEQVAFLALTKAARGYDPAYDHDFLSYAVPTIRGEVKKHFRDHGWTVRPPRRIQELQHRIMAASGELTHTLGRSPRPSEVAAYLDASIEDVTEALAADGCFAPASLDRRVGEDGETPLGDLIGMDDCGLDAADARLVLGPLVRGLAERDRRIIYLRFFKGCTQEEIAQDIGVTQMQVSRLLTRILSTLRASLRALPDSATA
jgi:RNA polymerase sigma-B factor